MKTIGCLPAESALSRYTKCSSSVTSVSMLCWVNTWFWRSARAEADVSIADNANLDDSSFNTTFD